MANFISLESLQAFLAHNLATVHRLRFVDVAYALGSCYALVKIFQIARCRLKTTDLRGPPNPSFLWGVGKETFLSPDSGQVYEKWAEEYGGVYEVAGSLGSKKIVLCDPKAIAHLWGGEPWTYVLTPFGFIATETFVSTKLTTRSRRMLIRVAQVGKGGMLTARGESHRRLVS